MKTNGEQGIALVLSLFLIAAMSVIAASLMLLSQTETYSSMNYRLMSQARYGAESCVHM
jgi:type II secretory pathway component PulK